MVISKSGRISFDETKLNNNLLFKLASNWENVQGEIFPNGGQGYVYHPYGANLQAADLREMATFLDELNGVEYVGHPDQLPPIKGANKYYYCSIINLNSGYEYPAPFLMIVKEGESKDEKLQRIFETFNGEGEQDGKLMWYQDCLAAKDPSGIEIPERHYNVMSIHLDTLEVGTDYRDLQTDNRG